MIRAKLLSLALVFTPLSALAEISVTDILGREVVLEAPAERIVLGEGRHMAVLGLLHEDPVSRVVGWRLDKALDEPTMEAYRAKLPAIDTIKPVGSGNRNISAEAIIALRPDLLVLSLMDQADPAIAQAQAQVEAAGIPVVYVDFFSHPLENSLPSLAILAKLTEAEPRAEAFAKFYTDKLNLVRDRLAQANPERPRVFFHVHAAPTGCCATVGTGVFADFIKIAGGSNIASEALDNVLGNVSLEFLLSTDPDIYVATGGTHMAARGGLVLGSGVTPEEAQTSFQSLISAPGFSSLRAIEAGRSAGVWHLFNDSPSHIALIEYLAKTFHPELFADLDPAQTLRDIETEFSPVSVAGAWWVTAQD